MKKKLEWEKLGIIFLVGFILYMAIEVIWQGLLGIASLDFSLKGGSSIYMGLLGGILIISLGLFNEWRWMRQRICILLQAVFGSLLITLLEFISGLILNKWLGFEIWSYSAFKYDWLAQVTGGEICFTYMGLWLLLSPVAFWADDQLRWIFYRMGTFTESNGNYSLWWLYSQLFNFKVPDYKSRKSFVEEKIEKMKVRAAHGEKLYRG